MIHQITGNIGALKHIDNAQDQARRDESRNDRNKHIPQFFQQFTDRRFVFGFGRRFILLDAITAALSCGQWRRTGQQSLHGIHHFGSRPRADNELMLGPLFEVAFHSRQRFERCQIESGFVTHFNPDASHTIFQFANIGFAANTA